MQGMSTYATPADLQARYSERDLRNLTDPDAQQFDAARAEAALADAAVEIDSYVGQRYLLPLQNLQGEPLQGHAALLRCACDIAMYRLATLRPSDDIKDTRTRYEDVVRLLVRIVKGEVQLEGCASRDDVRDRPAMGHSAGLPVFDNPPSVWAREFR